MEKFIVSLSSKEEQIRSIIEPLLMDQGIELVSLKVMVSQGNTRLIILIDKLDANNRIELGEIEKVSRFLGDVIAVNEDELLFLKSAYNLEISSPGLDRPLTKKSHFEQAVGSKVKLRLKNAQEACKNFTGVLIKIGEKNLVLQSPDSNTEELSILFDNIFDAKKIYQFPQNNKPKKKQ